MWKVFLLSSYLLSSIAMMQMFSKASLVFSICVFIMELLSECFLKLPGKPAFATPR